MSLRTRYLALLAMRWFATGLIIPVSVLLPLARGLSLTEIGVATAAQGVVVLLLEVPSGALTDSWGRRPVLVLSALVAAVAYVAMTFAQDVVGFALAWALCGVFRALDSGPLEAWFVDAERARGAEHEVPSALAVAGSVLSAGIAAGSLLTAGLLWWVGGSGSTLALPYAVAAVIVVVQAGCALALMDRAPRASGGHLTWSAVLGEGLRVALGPGVRMLTAAMVVTGFGVIALESLMPVRLDSMVDGDTGAGSLMGLVAAAAWGFAAIGSAATSRLLKVVAPATVSATLVAAEGLGLVLMAVAAGPALLVAGYWTCYLVHTGFGSSFNSLVHARVDGAHRGTVLSVTSMAFLGSAAVGSVLMGSLADRTSPSTTLLLGAGFLLVVAALVATHGRRHPRARTRVGG